MAQQPAAPALAANGSTANIQPMTGLDFLTFLVLAVLLAAGIALAYVLGSLPGKIALSRGHPQADAIRVAGWLGLLTLGLLFPVALIWAYTRPAAEGEIAALRQDVDRLSALVDDREAGRAPRFDEGPRGA
jgi:hypothetical protein